MMNSKVSLLIIQIYHEKTELFKRKSDIANLLLLFVLYHGLPILETNCIHFFISPHLSHTRHHRAFTQCSVFQTTYRWKYGRWTYKTHKLPAMHKIQSDYQNHLSNFFSFLFEFSSILQKYNQKKCHSDS